MLERINCINANSSSWRQGSQKITPMSRAKIVALQWINEKNLKFYRIFRKRTLNISYLSLLYDLRVFFLACLHRICLCTAESRNVLSTVEPLLCVQDDQGTEVKKGIKMSFIHSMALAPRVKILRQPTGRSGKTLAYSFCLFIKPLWVFCSTAPLDLPNLLF